MKYNGYTITYEDLEHLTPEQLKAGIEMLQEQMENEGDYRS
jgi:hypothetical protein